MKRLEILLLASVVGIGLLIAIALREDVLLTDLTTTTILSP